MNVTAATLFPGLDGFARSMHSYLQLQAYNPYGELARSMESIRQIRRRPKTRLTDAHPSTPPVRWACSGTPRVTSSCSAQPAGRQMSGTGTRQTYPEGATNYGLKYIRHLGSHIFPKGQTIRRLLTGAKIRLASRTDAGYRRTGWNFLGRVDFFQPC